MKRSRLIPLGAVVAIACGVALLLWPLTLDSPGAPACGNAIQRGPVYDILVARYQFLSIEQYQPIKDCDDLRLRNRILGIGFLVVSGAIVIAGRARPRRVGG